LKCRVILTSNYLHKHSIKPHWEKRILEVIRLREIGYTNKEIAVIFNNRGWRKWIGKSEYNRSDIGMMVLKWKKRQKLNTYTLIIGEWVVE